MFNIALTYQQGVRGKYLCQLSQEGHELTEAERELRNSQNDEKSQSMRLCVVLSSVVVGMTAFFSMLVSPGNRFGSFISSDSFTYKQDLELRGRLSQLLKIVCVQFALCQSYSIGMHAGYARAVLDKQSWENKLYNTYVEHIHLLYINKKIASEDDYLIFNTKN